MNFFRVLSLLFGLLCAFLQSIAIGANDASNSFASAVGSKSLPMIIALICGSILEFLGAVLFGKNVANKVANGLIQPALWKGEDDLLIAAMIIVMITTIIWLISATAFKFPVSGTHASIGAILGITLFHTPKEFDVVEILQISISWVVSPFISGILSIIVYILTRTLILRSKRSLERTSLSLHIYYGIVACLCVGFVVFGIKGLPYKPPIWLSLFLICLAFTCTSAFILLVGRWLLMMWIDWKNKGVYDDLHLSLEKSKGLIQTIRLLYERVKEVVERVIGPVEAPKELKYPCEEFDDDTEAAFKPLLTIISFMGALAHGANDVANSVAPVGVIIGTLYGKSPDGEFEIRTIVLVLGGVGIAVGLLFCGWRVIRSVGTEITRLTPARGACIEIGAVTVLLVSSVFGIPLSSTQCKVGSLTAVGLVDNFRNLNYKIFMGIAASWLVTVPFNIAVSYALFGICDALFFRL